VDDDEPDAGVQIGRALGDEGFTIRRSIFVRRADEFNRPGQLRATGPTEDSDLDDYRRELERMPRLRRCRPGSLRRAGIRLAKRRHVYLDTELHIRLSEVAGGQA